jgi:hypothetical protein
MIITFAYEKTKITSGMPRYVAPFDKQSCGVCKGVATRGACEAQVGGQQGKSLP